MQHSAVLWRQTDAWGVAQADLRFQSHAIAALQESAEIYITNLFEVNGNASTLTRSAKLLELTFGIGRRAVRHPCPQGNNHGER